MSTEIISEITFGGLQNFEKYSSLNPIQIHVSDSKIKIKIINIVLLSLGFYSSFINDTNVVFITCNGLNDSRKALVNRKSYNTLRIYYNKLAQYLKFFFDIVRQKS